GSSFNGPASLEYDSGLGRACLTRVLGYVVSSGGSEGDYTAKTLTSSEASSPTSLLSRLLWLYLGYLCMDDNRSCMKDWKTGFFYIDRGSISDSMPWRHADLVITDLKPLVGSYDETEVMRLSAFIVKLCDMPKGVLVLSGLSRVWKSLNYDPILRNPMEMILPFYCTVVDAAGSSIPEPTTDELTATVPDTKVLAKAKKSKKRKASTFGTASSQVTKRTRSSMAHAASGSARKSLFDESSDDKVGKVDVQDDEQDDYYVEIPLVTPIWSATMLPFEVNQGGENSIPSAAEASLFLTCARTKETVDGRVDTPSGNADRPQGSYVVDPFVDGPSSVAPSTADDDIERDFFPFMPEPYYFPTPAEVVRVESLFDEKLTQMLSVVYCVMMSQGGKLLVRFQGLIKAHDQYKMSSELKLKGLQQQISSINGLNFQISDLKKQVLIAEVAQLASDLNDARRAEARKSDQITVTNSYLGDIHNEASRREFASFFKGGVQGMVHKFLGSDRFPNFMPGAQDKLPEATPLVAIVEYPYLKMMLLPPSLKELTATPDSLARELASKDIPSSSKADESENPPKEQNEEWFDPLVGGLYE
ncbi:hypothetical protein Tco_1246699, partial [Tanacetum coccineum]